MTIRLLRGTTKTLAVWEKGDDLAEWMDTYIGTLKARHMERFTPDSAELANKNGTVMQRWIAGRVIHVAPPKDGSRPCRKLLKA